MIYTREYLERLTKDELIAICIVLDQGWFDETYEG